jgi:hypothetical protein
MAGPIASLPAGSRITDYISLGVVAKFFPARKVHEILQATNRASIRERDLPAQVVVYYVIALALYMRSSYREVLRCLLEGVQWLLDPPVKVIVAGKSGISQARSRVGAEPLKRLYEAVVAPIAQPETKGAWYRQWRVVSLDGSTVPILLATMAVRQQSRIVRFESAAEFLDTFGLSKGGKEYRRLVSAFERIFGATIFFGTESN